MLSLKYIVDNQDYVKKSSTAKNVDIDLKEVLKLDLKRKEFILEVESLKAQRNILNKNISQKVDIETSINKMKVLSADIKLIDKNLSKVNNQLNSLLQYIPNIIHESVPIGTDESDNIVVREWGNKPDFDFDILGHQKLCEKLNLVDFKRSTKISGSGFPLYVDNGARLERSLITFMLEYHLDNSGYTELLPPLLVNANSPTTTGNLPKFKDDMYYIDNDNLFCIPTAEVPVTNFHANEVLLEEELPKKYVAYSSCFRREAGSYGKDTKGMLRLHQFNKVELVKFVNPEKSYEELESLLLDAEKILQALGLHYRVVSLASGDLSFSASKCYDIEVWSPFENKFLEVSSCSNFESFQARRGNIKYRKKHDNKLDFLHTLNGSGLATPRLLVSLLETYQNKNQQIELPDSLAKYFGSSIIK